MQKGYPMVAFSLSPADSRTLLERWKAVLGKFLLTGVRWSYFVPAV
jgi:hypothetical protein